MEITVKVVLSADAELMTTLATLVECVQDVLHVSNSQLAAAEAEKPKRTRKKKAEEPVTEPVKEEPMPTPVPEPEPAKEEPAPEPVKEDSAPFQDQVKEIVMRKPIGTSKKVLELLKTYGWNKVREVPEDKQAEFLQKVEAL